MGRVEEIIAAIASLPPAEYRRVVQWLRVREQMRWDGQLNFDARAGHFEFLFEEAKRESTEGVLREWPPAE